MMSALTLAAEVATQNQPGWGKLLALVIAGGGFFIATQVHKRIKAVREGKEINPYSPEVTGTAQPLVTEVSAPLEAADTGTRKGFGKWLRKG